MNFLESLQESPLAEWVLYTDYGYYVVLSCHAVGMGIVAGIVYMLALRTLGVARRTPIHIFDRLITLAWAGFALNAISGLVIFASNGPHLVANGFFLAKLTLIAVGGIAVWVLWRTLEAEPAFIEGTAEASTKAKITALAVAAAWTGALVAGRLIAYTAQY